LVSINTWQTRNRPRACVAVPSGRSCKLRHSDGSLRLHARESADGNILRTRRLFFSCDHDQRGNEVRLRLKDSLALYGVKNALLAPGYRSPELNKVEP